MKSDYYIIKRQNSILIIRRGGTFLPIPGHFRVKTKSDQNIHQNAPNYIIFGHFLVGACPCNPQAKRM